MCMCVVERTLDGGRKEGRLEILVDGWMHAGMQAGRQAGRETDSSLAPHKDGGGPRSRTPDVGLFTQPP